jgi:hypothetical protein
MSDRADYLARTLSTRLAQLRARFAEDRRGEPDRQARLAVIEKILAVEFGLTDAATLAGIEAAAPSFAAAETTSPREQAALAEFLRRHLAAHLDA